MGGMGGIQPAPSIVPYPLPHWQLFAVKGRPWEPIQTTWEAESLQNSKHDQTCSRSCDSLMHTQVDFELRRVWLLMRLPLRSVGVQSKVAGYCRPNHCSTSNTNASNRMVRTIAIPTSSIAGISPHSKPRKVCPAQPQRTFPFSRSVPAIRVWRSRARHRTGPSSLRRHCSGAWPAPQRPPAGFRCFRA